MNAYVHRWGASFAADAVWAHVNGLAPSRRARRLLMVWQGYIDESVDSDFFVFAGYLAPAEAWSKFAAEWERMLPQGILGNDRRYRFKMSEMAALPERMARVPGFYRIIENHVSMILSFTMRLSDFEAGKSRLLSIDRVTNQIRLIGGHPVDNPYVFAFTQMMSAFHKFRSKPDIEVLVSPDERVDFIFDDRMEKKIILASWDDFMENTGGRELYGATPRFESDDDFLPLQAADFKAWWVRHWASTGAEHKYPWKGHRELHWLRLHMDEDAVFETLKIGIEKQFGTHRRVFDRKALTDTAIPLDSSLFGDKPI